MLRRRLRWLVHNAGTSAYLGVVPVLRVYFTSDDIGRIRIAQHPDPLWELVLAVHMLRRQSGDLQFTHWRSRVTAALRRTELGPRLGLLLALLPPIGYFPDFLNPIAASRGLEHGLEAIRSTPRAVLQREIQQLAGSRQLPTSAGSVASGSPSALVELTETMQTCYNLTVAPFRQTIETVLARDRDARMTALADQGVDGLFGSLCPLVRWSAGELRIPAHRDQELHLDGRGLLLIPAYFCIRTPVTMFDPELPPVLVYPAQLQPNEALFQHDKPQPTALPALIGATRTAVLDTIGDRRISTTTELARHLAISMASASEHTRVLRDAGLITSHRDRNRMLHQMTPLGRALRAGPPQSQSR